MLAVSLALSACGDGGGAGSDQNSTHKWPTENVGPVTSAATYGGGTGNTMGVQSFDVQPRSVSQRTSPSTFNQVTLSIQVSEPSPGTTTCLVAFNMPGSWNIAAGGAMTGTSTRFLSIDLQVGDIIDGHTVTTVAGMTETAVTTNAGAVVTGGTGLVYRYCPSGVNSALAAGTTWGPFYPQANPTSFYMHVDGIGGRVLIQKVIEVATPAFTNRCTACNMGAATRGLGLVYDYGIGTMVALGGDLAWGYDARRWGRYWNAGTNQWVQWADSMPQYDLGNGNKSGRAYFTAVYDRANAKTVINSGVDDHFTYGCGIFGTCDDNADDRAMTFEFNSSNNTWENNAVSSNGTVNKYAAVYADNGGWTNRVLVHSGSDLRGATNRADDLRAYNSASNTWTGAITGSSGPGARWGHAMAWNSTRNTVVLYGGCNATTGDNAGGGTGIRAGGTCADANRLNDVWEWNNSSWTSRPTTTATGSTAPTSRYNHGLAYDPVRRRVILYGGTTTNCTPDPCNGQNDQLWELDLAPATAVWYGPYTGTSVARALFGMAWNPARNSLFVVNGHLNNANQQRVDERMTTNWDQIASFSVSKTWIAANTSAVVSVGWTTEQSGALTPCTVNNYVTPPWTNDSSTSFTNGGTIDYDSTSPERRSSYTDYVLVDCGSRRADITVQREAEIRSFNSTPLVINPGPSAAVTLNWEVRAVSQCRVYRVDPGPTNVLLGTYNYNGNTSPLGSHSLGTLTPPVTGYTYELDCDGYTSPNVWGTITKQKTVGVQGNVAFTVADTYTTAGSNVNLAWTSSAINPGACVMGGLSVGWIYMLYNQNPADGDAVIFTDYVGNKVIFEFDSNSTTSPPPSGYTTVAVTINATPSITRDNLITAINANALQVTAQAATSIGTNDANYMRVRLRSEQTGVVNNLDTVTVNSPSGKLAYTSFSGGLDDFSVPDSSGSYPFIVPTLPVQMRVSCQGFDSTGTWANLTSGLRIWPQAQISSFSASPVAIPVSPNAFSIQWTTNGAIAGNSCQLSGTGITTGSAYSATAPSPPGGSFNTPLGLTNIAPTANYTITCQGDPWNGINPPNGNFATANLSVPLAVKINSFTASTPAASPGVIYPGGSSQLNWTTNAAATSCDIDNGIGSVALNGSVTVSPVALPTMYTLTCQGAGGPVSAQFSVLQHVQALTLVATPQAVLPNGTSTLSFTTVNATACTMDPGGNVIGAPFDSGVWVTPNISPGPGGITYTLNCTGTGGADTLPLSVTVYPAVQINTFTSRCNPGPTSNCAGVQPNDAANKVDFTWTTVNAAVNGCSIDNGVGIGLPANGTNLPAGGVTFPSPPATVSITCNGTHGDSAVSNLVVPQRVQVLSVTANPAVVVPGFTTDIAWNTVQASVCNLDDDGILPNLYSNISVPAGVQTLTFPSTPKTYTVTCTGTGAQHSLGVTVTAPTVVTITGFTSNLAAVPPSGTVNLTWGSYLGTSCTVTSAQTTPATNLSGLSGAAVATQPITTFPADFLLSCAGPGGPATRTLTIQRKVSITSFTATPSPSIPTQNATLTWVTGDATSCDIDGQSGFGNVTIPSASMVINGASTSPLPRTYVLTCQGPGGPVTANATIADTTSVKIASFTTTANAINIGQQITLSWSTYRATTGCTLNPGAITAVTANAGNLVVNGSTNLTPASLPTTYTLNCGGPAPTPVTATQTITDKGWVQVVSGLSGASARERASAVYDSVRSKAIVFGGYNNGFKNDIWEWDGASWTQSCTGAPCTTTQPEARYAHSMAYDATNQRTVLFGGYSDTFNYLVGTWVWNGAGTAWTKAEAGAGAASCDDIYNVGASSPAPRTDAAMAYDTARSRVILYGGRCGEYVFDDMWEWNGATSTWARTCTACTSGTQKPLPVYGHTMVYDQARSCTVLYGGTGTDINGNPVYYPSTAGDTWLYNTTANTCGAATPANVWTKFTPADPDADGNPSARRGAGMAYDVHLNRSVLFGGEASDGVTKLNDTWVWYLSGTMTWKQALGTFSALTPRTGSMLIYDGAAGRTDMLLLTGVGSSSPDPLGDYWKWDL